MSSILLRDRSLRRNLSIAPRPGTGWRSARFLAALAVAALAGRAGAAGSTAGVDLKKFAVDTSLNRFWLYVDSTLNTGTGFATAAHGKVGVGDYVTGNSNTDSFKTTTIVRGDLRGNGPTWVFDSSLYVHGNAEFRSTQFRDPKSIVQIDGTMSFANNGGTSQSAIWVAKNATIVDNNVKLYGGLHLGADLVLQGLNTNPPNLRNVFNAPIYSNYTINGGTAGSLLANGVGLVAQVYAAPQAAPRFYAASELPGATATFTLPGEREYIDGASYAANVCPSVGCANYNGISGNGKSTASGKVLPPGYYGTLHLDNSQVVLGEGIYYFDDVQLVNSGARMVAYQPNGGRTIVYTRNGLNATSGGFFIGPDSGILADRFGLSSSSSDFSGGTMMIVAGPNAPITIGSDASLWATLSTPTGTIRMNSQIKLFGQMFARHFVAANRFSGGDGEFIPFFPDKPVVTVANFGWKGPEGATGQKTNANFRLVMDHVNGAVVQVWYHTVTPTRDTAIGGVLYKPAFAGDYDSSPAARSGSVSVPITQLTASFDIVVHGNDVKQPNRYFLVVLDGIVNGSLDSSNLWNGKVAGIGLIEDDDPTPAIRVQDVSQDEGTAPGTRSFKFFVNLVNPYTGVPLTSAMSGGADFTWSTLFGSAGSADLTAVSNKAVSWPVGKVSDTLTVQVVQDAMYEGNETFSVRVAPTTAGNVQTTSGWARATATGTIVNDDAPPTLTLSDAPAVVEGGTSRFAAALSAPSGFPVCFNWNTSDLSARAGSDYLAASGTGLCIPAGATRDTLDVKTLTDDLYEGTESFRMNLGAVTGVNATGNRLVATGTILDDDPRPGLWIRDTSVRRPATGWTNLKFVVSLVDSATGRNLTKIGLPTVYDWSTAPGTALADTDFAMASGRRTLAAGATTDTITVLVRGDARYHPPLTFSVQLSAPSTVSPSASRLDAVGTILGAVGRPVLSVADGETPEGDLGRKPFSFTVSLRDSATGDPVSSRVPLSFDWTTTDATAKTGVDHQPVDGRGTIPAGETNATIVTDSVIGNAIHQADRTFAIELAPVGTDLRPGTFAATGTIRDDDPAPWVVVDDASLERDTVAGSRTPMWFQVRLLDPRTGLPTTSGLPVAVTWKTVDGTAVAGLDYVASSGTLTIPVGTGIDSLAVPVLGDARFAPENSFKVALTGIVDGTGRDTLAVGTIRGGARKPRLALKGGTVVRPTDPAATAPLPFAFYLVDPLTGLQTTGRQRIDFTWSTFDSTALAGKDFTKVQNAPDRLAGGLDTDTLRVTVRGSSSYAPPSLVGVTAIPFDTTWVSGDTTLSRTTGLILDSATNTGRFATPDTSLAEPADSVLVRIAVRLQLAMRDSTVHLPVRVDQAGTTARENVNFRLLDTLAVFAPGELYDTIGLMVLRDGIHSGTVRVRLDLLPNLAEYIAVTDPDRIDVVVQDADPAPTISFVDTLLQVREADTTVSIVLGLDLLSSRPIAGSLVRTGGSARPGVDFEFGNGAFTFPPLARLDTLPLRILNDHRFGPDRDVVLGWGSLADSSLATFGTDRSRERVVILESDPKPTLAFAEDTLVVTDALGRVDLRMVLDSLSDSTVLADLVFDTARGRVAGIAMVADSAYAVRIDSGTRDTSYRLVFGNDGKVGPDRVVHLVLRNPRGALLGADSVLVVVIRNTNRPPEVRILTPADSSHTSNPNQRIEWTVDGTRQPPGDTTLREGWNTVSRCHTDTAGNTGCDAHQVWGDFTPPAVRVFKITGPYPLDPSKDTTWWGDKARTRFGKDTVWYWTRDSILGDDGNWRVKVDTLKVVTDFSGDSLFPVQVRGCDSVGNCAMDTGWIDLKQSLPVVGIETPPEGAHVVAGLVPVVWSVADDGRSWTNADLEGVATPGVATITRCHTDDVGNKGCAQRHVVVEPVHAVGSYYVDTDGDGRVDAAVVELDSRWTGTTLPSFDFRWGDSLRTGAVPDPDHPFYAGPSRGTVVVVGSDTLHVDVGPYLTDSVGTILKGPDGQALTGILGDTAYGSDGKPLRDGTGRVYFKVAADGRTDSTRFLVPIKPPFAFGMTGFDSAQPARMVTSWEGKDSSGKTTTRTFVDTFEVGDRVPPVIVRAEIHRVETYTAPDTLFVTPSESLKLGEGRDWLQVGHCAGGASTCDSRDLIWVDVPDTAVKRLSDGRYWFLVPTDSMSIRPDHRVRFRSDVADTKGNGVDVSNLNWSTVVSGAPRPDLVKMTPPSRIPEIPASERDRRMDGGILIRATNGIGSESTFAWWEPGTGYLAESDPKVRAICPVREYCNGPKVNINRPVRLIVYIYDLAGTYVSSRTIDITKKDIEAMKADQLDRLTIEFDWNHRTDEGRLVSTGIYLWRIVSYVVVEGRSLPAISNQLYKVGVKIGK